MDERRRRLKMDYVIETKHDKSGNRVCIKVWLGVRKASGMVPVVIGHFRRP